MKIVKNFFRDLHEKRAYQVVFFVVSMCVVFGIYARMRTVIAEEKSHEYVIVEDKELVKYIEEVNVEKGKIIVSGWCFYRNIDSNRNQVQVFLRNLSDEEDIIWLDTENIVREDINEYYGGTVDYSQTGFVASARLNKQKVKKNNYEIFVKLTYGEEAKNQVENKKHVNEKTRTVTTKRYICDGILTALRPEEIKPMDAISEELREVVSKGQLLVHRADYDMYVYQYGNKMYWVAGEKFYFEEDGLTYIQYHLDTSRIDMLPEDRLQNQWYWDNRGFVFEEMELLDKKLSPYRVAVCEIPNDYPVTCCWTGYHNGTDWVWREYTNLDVRELKEEK